MKIDFGNVQGMVVSLYRRPIARHLLFRFGEGAAARAFMTHLLARVTMADHALDSAPDPLVNVGLTFRGLQALGVAETLLTELDAIYQEGPDPGPLGDALGSRSDPARWWEGQFATEDVHCIVHISVRSDGALEPASAEIRDLARDAGITELVPREDGTRLDARSLGGGKLHFGYTDGISQPDIYWDDASAAPGQVDFRNFLLGYSSETCSSAPRTGPAADLVRDSAYGAFRWIYQDVAAFTQFLRTQGPRLFPHLAQADAEELLAAKLMGRWRDGTPLALSPDAPDPTMAASNDFGYRGQDPSGYRCPFSAHIRVVNPRDQELDPIVEGVPRVIRRGMPYGPPLRSARDDGVDRGIIGLFLCSDPHRQIYTLTGWIKQNNFSPVYDANRRVQDALVGNRAVPGTEAKFILPSETGATTVSGLPDFVHTKGTVFLLYPSKATLRKLAVEP
ncbi:MAG: Dyp-type peroxidase [Pseudonocardiaceae bacterium]